MKIELTHEIIEALDADAMRAILKQLTVDLKQDVDERIAKVKAELSQENSIRSNQRMEESHSKTKTDGFNKKVDVPDEIIEDIKKRLPNETLKKISKDYPHYNYSLLWDRINRRKKKVK